VTAPHREGLGQALRLGGRSTFSSWGAYLGAFLADWIAVLAAGASAGLFWLLPLGVELHTLVLGGVALGLLLLTAQVLRALMLGAGLLQATARLRGDSPPALERAVSEAASPSLAWFLYGILLEALRAGWQALALGLGGFAFVSSLIHGKHGALGAAGLAIAVTVAVALWIGFALWIDYAFARAMAGWGEPGRGDRGRPERATHASPQPEAGTTPAGGTAIGTGPAGKSTAVPSVAAALFDSVGILWRAPATPLAILVLTALIAGGFHLFVGITPGELVGPGGVRPLWLWGALLGTALAAFVDTGATLLRLGAFATLELERAGALPHSPGAKTPAEPVIEAAPIVEARPVPVGPSET
jgi:hypothetical protein